MATATLNDVEIDSDIESLVDSAFEELDCCSMRKGVVPCGGPIAGFQEYHTCVQGWMCKNHWEYALKLYATWRAKVEDTGQIQCAMCLGRFTTIKSFIRLTKVPE
ncbi:hypothetical protein SSEA_SKINNY_45 [Mycobacterium phage Skinny]|uniref:Uncharacterized protein n=6 Tax=Bongovirus bongo TaxID=1983750 RepID=A0A0M4S381_9CAUD|nr:glutaredoxin [Mycobacterium phage PegLeg]YP_009604902.1 hypothetical protein FDH95_gp044 [Mycobacterium phage Bongo]ALF00572.1 hypothetical protein SEA_BRICOLE_44 [Mycobacterium phage Bricole]AXQ52685.1 hypothetical protein SEA_IPHANE7_44 [Mycobacterium phage IPhane7]QDH93617.1 hypothetical protein SEA_LILHOMIEP_43 [Mycobacterium phage LilhomieP]QGJ93191.1 hypothetical protein SEA_TYDAWG_44 [Mycobacterium phage TyDawg]QUU29244.1 hypothetical protein [Mycobacterium phage SirSheldon]UXE0533